MDPWLMGEALTLIRDINQKVRGYGYHVSLGGQVLLKGKSEEQLELYFLPLEGSSWTQYPEKLVTWLTDVWGSPEDLNKKNKDTLRPWVTRPPALVNRILLPEYDLNGNVVGEREVEVEAAPAPDQGENPFDNPFIFAKNKDTKKVYRYRLKFMRGGIDRIIAYIL